MLILLCYNAYENKNVCVEAEWGLHLVNKRLVMAIVLRGFPPRRRKPLSLVVYISREIILCLA